MRIIFAHVFHALFFKKRTYVLDFLKKCGIINIVNIASASRRYIDV